MRPERALEIYQLGCKHYWEFRKFCTEEENAYVMKVWNQMPGYTCWADALIRIMKGEKPND